MLDKFEPERKVKVQFAEAMLEMIKNYKDSQE